MREKVINTGKYWILPIFSISLIIYSFSYSSNPYPNSPGENEYIVNATLYNQLSGEYRTLAFQAYSLAKFRLNGILKNIKHDRPVAVVVDLDETILDNSNFQGQLIKDDSSYTDEWKEYVNEAKAKAVPGAVEFLNYVNSCKVKYKHHKESIHIFYITNRDTTQKKATAINLKKLGFPQIDAVNIENDYNLMVSIGNTNKQARFDTVSKKYRILLQMGDNLNDFTGDFYGKSDSARISKVDSLEALGKIGKEYIILPNAIYGDWVSGLPKSNSVKDPAVSRRLDLKGYK